MCQIHQTPNRGHLIIVSGPAGCGKSSLAQSLSTILGATYVEGDDYHSQSNVDKMRNGVPLTDIDRWDWLALLRNVCDTAIQETIDLRQRGQHLLSHSPLDRSSVAKEERSPIVVLTCSALQHAYRDVLRKASGTADIRIKTQFLYLHLPEVVAKKRASLRQSHYMAAGMVHGQFETLEIPAKSEMDVVTIDANQDMANVLRDATAAVTCLLHEGDDN